MTTAAAAGQGENRSGGPGTAAWVPNRPSSPPEVVAVAVAVAVAVTVAAAADSGVGSGVREATRSDWDAVGAAGADDAPGAPGAVGAGVAGAGQVGSGGMRAVRVAAGGVAPGVEPAG